MKQTFTVDGCDRNTCKERDFLALAPFGTHNIVFVLCHFVHSHFAVGAVNHYLTVSHDADDSVALYGFAATCGFGVKLLEVAIEDERMAGVGLGVGDRVGVALEDVFVGAKEHHVRCKASFTEALCYLMFGDGATSYAVVEVDIAGNVEVAFDVL